MPEILWYYAVGDVEQGPVPAAKLWSMAQEGKLGPEDLVWKEGMENWAPAGGVQGLFPDGDSSATLSDSKSMQGASREEKGMRKSAPGQRSPLKTADPLGTRASPKNPPVKNATTKNAPLRNTASKNVTSRSPKAPAPAQGSSRTQSHGASSPTASPRKTSAESASPTSQPPRSQPASSQSASSQSASSQSASSQSASSRWEDPPLDDSFRDEPAPNRGPADEHQTSSRVRPDPRAFAAPREMSMGTATGRMSLFVGLIMVVLARGCDMLAGRYADRISAMSQMAEVDFQEQWNEEKKSLEQRRDELRSQGGSPSGQSRELQEVNEQITQLDRSKQEELQELRDGRWRQLRSTAQNARVNDQMWAFWRGGVFLVGTMLLAFGLAAVGMTAQGPERWVFFVMLGMILFSFYVDGGAWSGNGSAGDATGR